MVAAAPCVVGCHCVGAGSRTDRDHGVQQRVELMDTPQIKVRQLDGVDPVRIHQCLELRNRRLVDVDSGDLRVRRIGCEAGRRCRAGCPEGNGEYRRENEQTPNSAAHYVTSP